MTKSISDNTKRRGRPKTTGKGTLVGVRILPEMLDPLDQWISEQPDPKPTRPEAIREAVSDWLIALGLMKPPNGDPDD